MYDLVAYIDRNLSQNIFQVMCALPIFPDLANKKLIGKRFINPRRYCKFCMKTAKYFIDHLWKINISHSRMGCEGGVKSLGHGLQFAQDAQNSLKLQHNSE